MNDRMYITLKALADFQIFLLSTKLRFCDPFWCKTGGGEVSTTFVAKSAHD